MKQKILHYAKEILLFILVLTIFTNAFSWYKAQSLNKEKLPTIWTTLTNSETYQVPKNKAILVHIWATWCPTCSLEASNIQKLSKDYEVITIAVSSGTDADIQNYLQENDLNFKVINDNDGVYAKKFNISAYPTTFIYDKNANLVFSEVGYTSTLGLYIRMWWASL